MAKSQPAASGGLTDEQRATAHKMLVSIRSNLDRVIAILEDGSSSDVGVVVNRLQSLAADIPVDSDTDGQRQVVEGVFNGHAMIGADGREYAVPPNYASKSKLVEGDILKLTIDTEGNFLYKQIGPIQRQRVKAELQQDETSRQYYAIADGRRWKLITAAVTYYHGTAGDEVIVLIPRDSTSQWAAVENIIQ